MIRPFVLLAVASAVALFTAKSPAAGDADPENRSGPQRQVSGAELIELDLSELMGQQIVTATRREQRMQDIPLSVTAYPQQRLDFEGLRTIDQLAQLAPGVTFQRHGVGASANYNDENSNINLRGIDSASGASTVALYIDDTPIQTRHIGFGAINAFPVLFDLERVEVLRGPQGTLFGAGSEGGALRFIMPEPSLLASSRYVRTEVGLTEQGAESYEAGAAIGGPIREETLGFRLSASYRREGGYVDRVSYERANSDPATTPTFLSTAEQRSNWQETLSARAALKWAVGESVSLTPSIYYQRLYVNDTAAYWPSLSDADSGVFRNGNALPIRSTDPLWLAAVRLDWKAGFADVTSSTSYFSREQHSVTDYTQWLRQILLGNSYPEPGEATRVPYSDAQQNFYQEVRLTSPDSEARLLWSAGVFYSRLKENVRSKFIDPTLNDRVGGWLCADVACPDGVLLNTTANQVTDEQYALFGEMIYSLTSAWKATVGLRVSRVDYLGESDNAGAFLGYDRRIVSGSASETPVTPKAALSWQPNTDNLFYASASKGYRVGGIKVDEDLTSCADDLAAFGLPLGDADVERALERYSSDSLWSYELGAKSSLLADRLQVNSSVFVIDWKNIQQRAYMPTCGSYFIANLGRVRSVGGEIELHWRPVEPLSLDLTVAYTDAKNTEASCAGLLDFDGVACTGSGDGSPISAPPIASKGDRLVAVPWSAFAAAEYGLPLPANRSAYLRLSYHHMSAQTARLSSQNANNALYDTTLPGLPRVRNLSLRAGLRWKNADLSLFAQNLTNHHPVMFKSRDNAVNPADNLYFERTDRPRMVGLSVVYRFSSE